MKLSIITITCRSNPRLVEMAKTLLSSFRRAPIDTELQWLIVDDKLWWQESEARLADVQALLQQQPPDIVARFVIDHFAPPPTRFRGPTINDPLPAHNTARNAGLAAVAADALVAFARDRARDLDLRLPHPAVELVDYVVFLSDCTVVTRDWVKTACEIASQGQGWRCKTFNRHDLVVPEEPFAYQDCWDNLHNVMATSVSGPCWGAPLKAFAQVVGFDTAYDGEDDFHDHEILLRLGRAGVQFVTTKRACVVRLGRSRDKNEVTTRQEVLRAANNRARYNALVAAGADQILPGHQPHQVGAQPGRGVAHRPSRLVVAGAPAGVAPVAAARIPPAVRQPPQTAPRLVPEVPRAAGGGDDVRPPMGGSFVTIAPAKPMSIHERAQLLQQKRVNRAQADKDGTSPPLAEEEQCQYVPNQGQSKGQRCSKRARHGGAHGYGSVPTASPTIAQLQQAGQSQTKPQVSREPPEPPARAAVARETLDQYARGVQQQFADLPASYPKNAAILGRVLLRDGELVTEDGYVQMLADYLRAQALGQIQTIEEKAAEQARYDTTAGAIYGQPAREMLPVVQHLCLSMPPIPCSPAAFDELRQIAAELDAWRKAAGMEPRGPMSALDRGYMAAADAYIDIDSPDDFGDALADDLTRLERRAAANDDAIVSTEPLTDAEAAEQEAAAAALVAEDAARNES